MPAKHLKEFLDNNKVSYELIPHYRAFTAQEIAHAANIKGNEFAKAVIVKIDNELVMTVLPANFELDLTLLREFTGAQDVQLATEEEFESMFTDCELGAMPPFGNIYGIPVISAEKLKEDSWIAFNAGSHKELMRMPYYLYEDLVHPKIAKITKRRN